MLPDIRSISRFENEFEFLSNFYTAPFVWNGRCWPTVEHAYQAAKIPTPGSFWEVIAAKEAADAKRLGRRVKLREGWEEIKISIMTELVWLKFEYNLTLRTKLINTGKVKLIEGNWWHDNTWGDCFCKTCSNRAGKNVLGSILMEVREDFQKSKEIENV